MHEFDRCHLLDSPRTSTPFVCCLLFHQRLNCVCVQIPKMEVIYLSAFHSHAADSSNANEQLAYAEIHSQTDLLCSAFSFVSCCENVIRSTEVGVGLSFSSLFGFFFSSTLSIVLRVDSHCVWMQKNEHMVELIRLQTECVVTQITQFIHHHNFVKRRKVWGETERAGVTTVSFDRNLTRILNAFSHSSITFLFEAPHSRISTICTSKLVPLPLLLIINY